MAKPQKRTYATDLPEFTPVLLKIRGRPEVTKDDQDPDKYNVFVWFEVVSEPWKSREPVTTVRGRHGLTANPRSNGTPSHWAQLVNACHAADLSKAELADYDSDDLPVGAIIAGIGQITEKDGNRYWNINAYRRPSEVMPQQATAPAPAQAAAPTPADGYTYQTFNGVQHRWKDGMPGWEPVPVATPPPPPLPPPPPPPPPSPPPTTTAPPPPAAGPTAPPGAPAAGSPPPPPAPKKPELSF